MPRGIYIRTDKIRLALSRSHQGIPNPRKGINTLPFCLNCKVKLKDHRSKRCSRCSQLGINNSMFGKKRSVAARLKTSLANKGNPKCAWNKGGKWSIEHRLKLSKIQKERVVKGFHNFWKGGIDKAKHSERYALMKTMEYKLWREAVFRRDNFTCQSCGQYNGYLEVDHIKSWNLYPELRYAIDNGRTLCRPCHQATDTWGFGSSLKGVATYEKN